MVILCQVPPGFTRKIIRNKEFLYYQVETLIFGKAIERAINPERIILGCNKKNQTINKNLLLFLNAFSCPLLPMVYESAELAKTAINIILASQVSVANTLSEICENTNAEWFEIVPALNLDKRIGHFSYLDPGLGISGGNIERDLITISDLSKINNGNNVVLKSILEFSKYRKNWPYQILNKTIAFNKINIVSVLGLAYKINTNSSKNSPSITLINALKNKYIKAYDKLVNPNDFDKSINFCDNIYDTIKDSDVLFIMLPNDEFKEISWEKIFMLMRGKIVIDPFRVLPFQHDKKISHLVLGKNEL